MKHKLALLFFILGFYTSFSQVVVGKQEPTSGSAQLEIYSKDRGILIPRIALTESRDATSIKNGNIESLLVYNTATISDITPGYYYWYIDRWQKMATTDEIKTIASITINPDTGDIFVTYNDGTIINAGNAKGKKGDKGDDGKGITSSIIDPETGNLIITYTDGTKYDAGKVKGDKGDDGKGITSSIINPETGNLIITYTDGTKYDAGKVKGDKGDDGKGITSSIIDPENGNLIITYTDGTKYDAGKVKGDKGDDGKGIISSIIDPETGNLIITYTDGTKYDAGKVKGDKGNDGKGITSSIIDPETGNLIITYTDGTKYDAGKVKGDKGDDGKGITSSIIDPATGNLIITYTDGTKYDAGKVKGDKGDNGNDATVTKANLIAITPLTVTGSGKVVDSDLTVSVVQKNLTSITSDKVLKIENGPGAVLTDAQINIIPAVNKPAMLITDQPGTVKWSDDYPWLLGGNDANNGLSALKNLGTKTDFDLPFITNNTEWMRLTTLGRLGLGTTTPQAGIHLISDDRITNDVILEGIGDNSALLMYLSGTPLTKGTKLGQTTFGYNIGSGYIKSSNIIASYKGTDAGATNLSDMQFWTSNLPRMILDENGYLGIGTTVPGCILQIVNDAGSDARDDINIATYSETATPSLIQSRSRGTISSPMNLQNGDLMGSIMFKGRQNGTSSGMSTIVANYKGTGTTLESDLKFSTSSTVKMILDENGHLYPFANGTTSIGQDLGTSTNKWRYVYAANGVIQTSDIRLKKNIQPLKYGLSDILKIEPITYSWKDDSENKVKVGFSAQQLKTVIPEVINVGTDADQTLGVNYAEMVPVLINAIKEQQKQIDQLKEEIQKLNNK